MMMCELGVIDEVNLIFLIRGHTKNVCDKLFALLKKMYHYRNIYTMEQLHSALHSHPQINAVRVVDGDFVDLDSMMDKFYKHPASEQLIRHMSSL